MSPSSLSVCLSSDQIFVQVIHGPESTQTWLILSNTKGYLCKIEPSEVTYDTDKAEDKVHKAFEEEQTQSDLDVNLQSKSFCA